MIKLGDKKELLMSINNPDWPFDTNIPKDYVDNDDPTKNPKMLINTNLATIEQPIPHGDI